MSEQHGDAPCRCRANCLRCAGAPQVATGLYSSTRISAVIPAILGLSWFSSVPHKIERQYGHNRFLPHPSRFTHHLTIRRWGTERCEIVLKKEAEDIGAHTTSTADSLVHRSYRGPEQCWVVWVSIHVRQWLLRVGTDGGSERYFCFIINFIS
jgi:hypothetical protein